MVFTLFFQPKNKKPSNSKPIFKIQIHAAGLMGNKFPKMVPIPVTPPVAKPFGILKKYTPTESSTQPIFI